MHELHAGCAMDVLPHTGSCPLCRAPLLCTLGMPDQVSSISAEVTQLVQRERGILNPFHGPRGLIPRSAMTMHPRPESSSAAPTMQTSGGLGQLREASRPNSTGFEHAADFLPPHPEEPRRASSRRRQLWAQVRNTISKIPTRLPRIPWGRRSARVDAFTSRPETA